MFELFCVVVIIVCVPLSALMVLLLVGMWRSKFRIPIDVRSVEVKRVQSETYTSSQFIPRVTAQAVDPIDPEFFAAQLRRPPRPAGGVGAKVGDSDSDRQSDEAHSGATPRGESSADKSTSEGTSDTEPSDASETGGGSMSVTGTNSSDCGSGPTDRVKL